MNQKNRSLPIILFTIIVLILALTPLYFVLDTKNAPATPITITPSPTIAPAVTSTPSSTPAAKMNTYTSPNGRLQFSYPAGYTVTTKPTDASPLLNHLVAISGGGPGEEWYMRLEIQSIGAKGPAYMYEMIGEKTDRPVSYTFGTKKGHLYKDTLGGQFPPLSVWAWNCTRESFSLVVRIEQKKFDKVAPEIEPILSSASVDGITTCE